MDHWAPACTGMGCISCEAAGMRIITSKSEAMVLSRKGVDCQLQVGESFPQVEEFKYLRVLSMSDRKMKWAGDWQTGLGQHQCWWRCCGDEERAEPEAKTFNSQVNRHPNPHLWSWALGRDWKNETRCIYNLPNTIIYLLQSSKVAEHPVQLPWTCSVSEFTC